MLDKNTKDKVKVYVASDRVFLSIVREILADHDIPSMVIEPGTSGYMNVLTGKQNVYGAEIYVLKEDEEEARALIDAYVNHQFTIEE